MSPNHVAIRAMEFGVDIHERLHAVVSGGNVFQAYGWISQCRRINDRGVAGPELVDVGAEEGSSVAPESSLQPRFPAFFRRDDHKHAARDGLRVDRGRKGNLKLKLVGGTRHAKVGENENTEQQGDAE